MVNNHSLQLQPNIPTPNRRTVLWFAVVFGLVLATVLVLSASATPPNAVEVQMQSWVNELQQERLTAARHDAMRQLENAGERAVPLLLVALRSGDAAMRRNAADVLGYIASPNSLSGLQYALANDALPTVRRNAAWALGEINSYAALNTLQRASVLDSNALVRHTAQDSLARIRTRLALALGLDEQRLNAFAVPSSRAEFVYVATGRDLKISEDGGKSWTTLENMLPSLANVIAVSPSDPLTLYAGVDSLGLYKSVDGGHQWNAVNDGLPIAPGARLVISAITIDPNDPQQIFLAAGALLGTGETKFFPTAILVSQNGGLAWKQMYSQNMPAALTQLALKGNRLFALAGSQVLVYPVN